MIGREGGRGIWKPKGCGNTATGQSSSIPAGESILPGEVVYSNGVSVFRARADAFPQAKVVGISITGATLSGQALVMHQGIYERADWTAITGSAALTPNAYYFLDVTTYGAMTLTPPASGSGFFAVRLGHAISATELYFDCDFILKRSV